MLLVAVFCAWIHLLGTEIPKDKIYAKCDDPNNFTPKQKEVLLDAYRYAQKMGFGYILSAIAWQESCAGEYLVNFSDPSAGIFHAHIPVVIRQYTTLKNNAFNRNLIGQLLLQDSAFASKVALDQLLFWNQKYNGNKQKIIKSYNKGTRWLKSPPHDAMAQKYYEEVMEKIQKLQAFIPQALLEPTPPKKPQESPKILDTIAPKPKQEFYLLMEP